MTSTLTAHPRILLVEDEPAVLTTYLRALQAFEPLTAADGIAAQKLISEQPVDVVVCDLDLPRMGGLELMRWGKEHHPRLEWIVISGQATMDAAIQALKLGAFDFICKPVQSFLQLQTAVSNAARQQSLIADLSDARRASVEREQLVADLQTALRARDEFLSNASHELRTPLTSLQLQVQGTARLVEKQDLAGSAKFLGKLKVAGRQAEHLAAVVDRLLDGARCSTGELTLKREKTDLVEVARNVLRRNGSQAQSAGCSLSLHAKGAVLGSWDRPRLEQALSNLVSNALKYGSAAPIEVSVSGSSEWARIAVRDHGVGIEHEDLARIFGQFERAVSLRHYGGLGLGLYIARQIVEAHGGTIDAASEHGHGATFTVNLRRQQPALPEARVHCAAG